jgi:hypothetical protein
MFAKFCISKTAGSRDAEQTAMYLRFSQSLMLAALCLSAVKKCYDSNHDLLKLSHLKEHATKDGFQLR